MINRNGRSCKKQIRQNIRRISVNEQNHDIDEFIKIVKLSFIMDDRTSLTNYLTNFSVRKYVNAYDRNELD